MGDKGVCDSKVQVPLPILFPFLLILGSPIKHHLSSKLFPQFWSLDVPEDNIFEKATKSIAKYYIHNQ